MALMNVEATGVITRDPLHPKAKQAFCTNMDELKFTFNGKEIPTKDVMTAYIRLGVVQLLKRDDDGQVMFKDDFNPITTEEVGKVEYRGRPERCNCNMTKFKVPKWWDVVRGGVNI